jgi:hypothetical protein
MDSDIDISLAFLSTVSEVFTLYRMNHNNALDEKSDVQYEPIILVTRGDSLPKRNYERKTHPTYEVRVCDFLGLR